jgi:hypothetical protein
MVSSYGTRNDRPDELARITARSAISKGGSSNSALRAAVPLSLVDRSSLGKSATALVAVTSGDALPVGNLGGSGSIGSESREILNKRRSVGRERSVDPSRKWAIESNTLAVSLLFVTGLAKTFVGSWEILAGVGAERRCEGTLINIFAVFTLLEDVTLVTTTDVLSVEHGAIKAELLAARGTSFAHVGQVLLQEIIENIRRSRGDLDGDSSGITNTSTREGVREPIGVVLAVSVDGSSVANATLSIGGDLASGFIEFIDDTFEILGVDLGLLNQLKEFLLNQSDGDSFTFRESDGEARSIRASIENRVILISRAGGWFTTLETFRSTRCDEIGTPSTAINVKAIGTGGDITASTVEERELLSCLNKVDSIVGQENIDLDDLVGEDVSLSALDGRRNLDAHLGWAINNETAVSRDNNRTKLDSISASVDEVGSGNGDPGAGIL